MKNFITTFLISLSILTWIEAAPPTCSSITGNSLRVTRRLLLEDLSNSCSVLIPDVRHLVIVSTGRGYIQKGSLIQYPAAGSYMNVGGDAFGSCPPTITITVKANFGFSILNPTVACTVTTPILVNVIDRIKPTVEPFSITTSNTRFTIANLKDFFNSTNLYDNCTPFSVLKQRLEMENDPYRPTNVIIRCGVSNQYPVRIRTRDACGNYSNWSRVTVKFIDNSPPSAPTIIAPAFIPLLPNSAYVPIIPTHDRSSTTSSFYSSTVDNWTPPGDIIYSYRILPPYSSPQNFPESGINIGIPTCNETLHIRVCAQDCFGNGNLHLTDNLSGTNCTIFSIIAKDVTPPRFTSILCGDTTFIPANCSVRMPSLVPDAAVVNNCGTYTIFQKPGAEDILNDGIPNSYKLSRWSGAAPLPLSPALQSYDADPIINCANLNGIFKSYKVSYLIIDANGNHEYYNNCKVVSLITGITDNPGLTSVLESRSITNNTTTIAISNSILSQNFPNPFSESSTIKITSSTNQNGNLIFYNAVGQQVYAKSITLHRGENFATISKSELRTTGLITCALVSTESGKPLAKMIKMMVL
ncbi:MAG: hypothetical protein ABI844_10925 [Saprospiraceae bacterium]